MGYRDDLAGVLERRERLLGELAPFRRFGPPASVVQHEELGQQQRGLRSLAWPFVWLVAIAALFYASAHRHFVPARELAAIWGLYALPLIGMATQTGFQLLYRETLRKRRAALCVSEDHLSISAGVNYPADLSEAREQTQRVAFGTLRTQLEHRLTKARLERDRVLPVTWSLLALFALSGLAIAVAGSISLAFAAGLVGLFLVPFAFVLHLPYLVRTTAELRGASRNLADFPFKSRGFAADPPPAEEIADALRENDTLERDLQLYKRAPEPAFRVRARCLADEQADLRRFRRPFVLLAILLALLAAEAFAFGMTKHANPLSWNAAMVPFVLFALLHAATLAKVRSTLARRFVLAAQASASKTGLPGTPVVEEAEAMLAPQLRTEISALTASARNDDTIPRFRAPKGLFLSPQERTRQRIVLPDDIEPYVPMERTKEQTR